MTSMPILGITMPPQPTPAQFCDTRQRIEAVDGNRRHLCEVDASSRVLGYSHPGA